MAIRLVTERGMDIMLVSESNKIFVGGHSSWLTDMNLEVVTYWYDKSMGVETYQIGVRHTYIRLGKVGFHSCYVSLNITITDLVDYLQKIMTEIRSREEEAIIAGDFIT